MGIRIRTCLGKWMAVEGGVVRGLKRDGGKDWDNKGDISGGEMERFSEKANRGLLETRSMGVTGFESEEWKTVEFQNINEGIIDCDLRGKDMVSCGNPGDYTYIYSFGIQIPSY